MTVPRCRRCRKALVPARVPLLKWPHRYCDSCRPTELPVVASPAMTMQVLELQEWMDYHKLSLSISFSERAYNVDLRRPVGDGRSVSLIAAKAADFSVAVVAACENYERMYAKRTS